MSAGCPACGATGRVIERVTLDALLSDSARARVGPTSHRFCRQERCDVVYYADDGSAHFTTADLRVLVFQKSSDPSRFVCYCFEHRVTDLIDVTTASAIAERITDKCRQGLHRCAETNPQGACCLGNVRLLIKTMNNSGSGDEPVDTCCATHEPRPRSSETLQRASQVGIWSTGGALVAAVLSSACCWLPLLLVATGASAAGVAGVFEAYRVHFLLTTALLLGAGFYFVYARKPECAPGDACAVPDPKLRRVTKASLWVATVLVIAFATFPNYLVFLVDDPEPSKATSALTHEAYRIEGMTCEACAAHIESAIESIQGVARAEVSYPNGIAHVYSQPGTQPPIAAVIGAVRTSGYEARAVD